MADNGGAWQSEVFDNGQNYQHGKPGRELSPVPGVPAAKYDSHATTGGSKDPAALPMISIGLRVATIVFSTVAFAVTASNEGEETGLCGYTYLYLCGSFWKAVNSSNMAYLLSINVIVCFYSIVQLVISIVNSCTGKPVLSGPRTPASTITFTCDQALAFMLMAGCGAGACEAVNFKKGESGQLACRDGFTILCDKLAAAVAMSCVAFVCIGMSALMAYIRIYKAAKI